MAHIKILLLAILVALSSIAEIVQANSCSSAEKDAIALCAIVGMKEWNVTSVDYETRGRKFCCFIWNSLECQVKIAKKCDYSYAEELSRDTEKAYRTACTLYPRKSPKCVLPKNRK